MIETRLAGETDGQQLHRWIYSEGSRFEQVLAEAIARLEAAEVEATAMTEYALELERNMKDIIRVTGSAEMEDQSRINYALDTCRLALYTEDQ